MEKQLERLADQVKNKEYKELYPDTEVETVKENEDKVKESLFQVYGVIWNPELYDHAEENSHVTSKKIDELAETEQQRERISKGMGAVTVTTNDEDETIIPSSDVKYALTKKMGFWD